MAIIKRYSNRKLYDTQAKQYVTLESLAGLVRRGADVSVIDHASGEDITVLTLAQIIVEQEKNLKSGLPHVVLSNLIRTTNRAMSGLRSALPWPASGPTQIDAEIERRIEILIKRGLLTAEAGQRLAEQLAAVGKPPEDEHELEEREVELELRARGTPTREDIQALARQVETIDDEVDRLADQKRNRRC